MSKSRDSAAAEALPQSVIDILSKVFPIALIASLALLGWLLYGIFSGGMASVARNAVEKQQYLQQITNISLYLNISLVLVVISGALLFWEAESPGFIMLIAAALLSYGLQYSLDAFFPDLSKLTKNAIASKTLSELHTASLIIGVPGVILVLRNLWDRFTMARQGEDLATMSYGTTVAKGKAPTALIGAFAKCWQLPFCREGIRVKCPIFLAKTKCWKERVGCMCEENIIRLASGGEERKTVDMTKEVGFVPIGDLIASSEESTLSKMPTRRGPRGVRIPFNPHITPQQQRDRCRNCVIYNEHQRQKYQLLAPLVTMAVPCLIAWKFDDLRDLVGQTMGYIDALIAHVTFHPEKVHQKSDLTMNITNSLPVETLIIVCVALFAITWALRFLEYCTFRIKI